MEKYTVAICGMGISGAFIARACKDYATYAGVEIDITVIADTKGSIPSAAFWLRKVPDSVANGFYAQNITISSWGSREEYIRKQWGEQIEGYTSSFPNEVKVEKGFFAVNPIDVLLAGIKLSWLSVKVTQNILAATARSTDLVFVTFPTADSIEERRKFLLMYPVVSNPIVNQFAQNELIYVGVPGRMVRITKLRNYFAVEYTHDHKVNMDNISDNNVVSYVQDMHPLTPEITFNELPWDNVFPVGRFAQFKRSMLSHEAYDRAWEILKLIA